jgi:hypothetical protein
MLNGGSTVFYTNHKLGSFLCNAVCIHNIIVSAFYHAQCKDNKVMSLNVFLLIQNANRYLSVYYVLECSGLDCLTCFRGIEFGAEFLVLCENSEQVLLNGHSYNLNTAIVFFN